MVVNVWRVEDLSQVMIALGNDDKNGARKVSVNCKLTKSLRSFSENNEKNRWNRRAE